MTVTELQILLDLNYRNEHDVLEEHTSLTDYGYLFVDSEDGYCYLFDKNGKMDDIRKLKALYSGNVKKNIKKIVIPKSVESIGHETFWRCASLTSIKIPENVTSIGYWAFSCCTSLTSIEIPEGVKSIGESAFQDCTSLKSIKISESVESIGSWAFEHCTSLESIEIPEGVKNIEYEAFWKCTSLKSIKIPKSVESIEFNAFQDCTSLKEVIFKGETMDQVKAMEWYPWGIEDEAIIKCS